MVLTRGEVVDISQLRRRGLECCVTSTGAEVRDPNSDYGYTLKACPHQKPGQERYYSVTKIKGPSVTSKEQQER